MTYFLAYGKNNAIYNANYSPENDLKIFNINIPNNFYGFQLYYHDVNHKLYYNQHE